MCTCYIVHSYGLHNDLTLSWAALYTGDFEAALWHAEAPERWRCKRSFFDWLLVFMDGMVAIPWHVLIRFGRWHDILARPLPKDTGRFRVSTATAHYAKGIAFAVLGNIEEVCT